MTSLPPLPATIQFLRDMARAPSTKWPGFVRQAADLDRVLISEAGACAAMLALQVKPITAQCVQVVPGSENTMRQLLVNLADALQYEQCERGTQPFYIEKG